MKFYLVILLIGAALAGFVATSDLPINDTVVDRMQRIGYTSFNADAMTLKATSEVRRRTLKEMLENFGDYGPPKTEGNSGAEIERELLSDYGEMLGYVAKRCEKANHYITGAVNAAMDNPIELEQAYRWLTEAKKMCYN